MKQFIFTILFAVLMPFVGLAQRTADTVKGDSAASSCAANVQTSAAAKPASDSVVVSVLTCTPGSLIYELYGHTALRVREPERGSDWVFNYGTFSFNQPHFIWRFLLGETDYELGVVPYCYFYAAYVREGRGIEEQILNISQSQAKALVDALGKNLQPENATYRYNFFYDNCTTRALRMIENYVGGNVVWPKAVEGKTLRDIVHEFSTVSPWNMFGQDLLLGAEADQIADSALQQFAPIYVKGFIDNAKIVTPEGKSRNLSARNLTLLPVQKNQDSPFPITPNIAFGILLALVAISSLYEWKKAKYWWGIDAILFIAQGLAGCIIAFLFFFSTHPCVGSNWLIAFFNPLTLVLFPWYMKSAANGRRSWIMYLEMVMIAATLLAGVFGIQVFPLPVYFILATLAVRMVLHWAKTKQN